MALIGGGPTGVEFAAELHDLLDSDARVHYPNLVKLTKITLYDVADSILSNFDRSLVKCVHYRLLRIHRLIEVRYTEKMFSREGVSILTNHHVERVEAVCPSLAPFVQYSTSYRAKCL